MPAHASTGFLTQTPRLFPPIPQGELMGLRINIGKVRGEARVLSAPEPRHPSAPLAIVIICYKIKHCRLMIILYRQIWDPSERFSLGI